jgi:hypothetical protein
MILTNCNTTQHNTTQHNTTHTLVLFGLLVCWFELLLIAFDCYRLRISHQIEYQSTTITPFQIKFNLKQTKHPNKTNQSTNTRNTKG